MKTLEEVEPRIPLDPATAPFAINTPGSYYLTGDVDTLSAVTTVFLIGSSNVTIDLNGFGLIPFGGSGTNGNHSAIRNSVANIRNIVI